MLLLWDWSPLVSSNTNEETQSCCSSLKWAELPSGEAVPSMNYWKSLWQTGFSLGHPSCLPKVRWREATPVTVPLSLSQPLSAGFSQNKAMSKGQKMVQEYQCQGSVCVYSISITLVPPSPPPKKNRRESLKAVATLVQSGECDKDCWNSHKENRD